MWMCTCSKGENLTHDHIVYKKVKVDSDNVCQNCGYYAVWVTDVHGSGTEKEVTVVKKNTEELKIMTAKEAAKFLGIMYNRFRPNPNGTPYKPEGKDYVVFPKPITKLSSKDKEHVFDKVYHCYDLEGNVLYKSKCIKEICKLSKTKRTTVMSNMRGQTIHTKDNLIFRDKPNFDVKGFLRTIKKDQDFDDLDYNWKSDIMSYDNEELGISYEPDYYGTWKEKLYS